MIVAPSWKIVTSKDVGLGGIFMCRKTKHLGTSVASFNSEVS